MRFDVDQELGGGKMVIDQIAFKLGKVDAIGCEAAQSLVKRGGHGTNAEDKGGDGRAAAAFRPVRLSR